jgi:signal transduction histidine kinase
MLAFTTPKREFRWLLIDEQPLSIVLQSVNASTRSLQTIGTTTLILAIVLASLITYSLVRPLRLLRSAVHKLRDHSWQDSLKLTRMVNSRDEVGELAEAFENMLHELQHVYHTLEQRVTERTQELAEANEQLQKLDEIKVRFMEDMAHEVRTPLSSISLNMELMERNPRDFERYMTRVLQNIQHIRRMIENVSAVARTDSITVKPEFSPFRLSEIVVPVVEMHRTLANENGLTLNYEAEEVLPVIYGHYNQLSQVVDNLVTNAIKYSDAGSIDVRLYHDKAHKQVCFTVQDTGIGIAPEDMARLFERYYRADNVRQSTRPGTGLGLSIVKEIIEWHKGTIDFKSELGVGTTATVCLPIATIQGL